MMSWSSSTISTRFLSGMGNLLKGTPLPAGESLGEDPLPGGEREFRKWGQALLRHGGEHLVLLLVDPPGTDDVPLDLRQRPVQPIAVHGVTVLANSFQGPPQLGGRRME